MLLKKQLHPDPPTNSGTPAAPAKVSTNNIPLADVDFFDVAREVADNWLINATITLAWKKSTDFDKEVRDYGISLTTRRDVGSLRPGQSFTLGQFDTQIDAAVKEVKVYVERKFKTKAATAQFARYGIVKEGGSYRISRDRNNRKEALKLMKAAIAADGFAAEEFGTPFWTNMETDYTAALTLASSTTGDVSGKVSTKNEQKKAIKKVMTSLLNVLKGNFPDTYKAEYRKWGWKKESF